MGVAAAAKGLMECPKGAKINGELEKTPPNYCPTFSLRSNFLDAALLIGPLYHIADSAGRLKALEELGRILKPEFEHHYSSVLTKLLSALS